MLADYIFLLESAVIWAILLVALFCYGLLIELCFMHKASERWFNRTQYWLKSIKTILASLPLLGLLGTITGLLTTFFRMSVENGFNLQEVISGGIAEAMFTTQLGLIMVIPGLLMLSYLQSKVNQWMALKK
ncbi:MotA/TolQ/ExbB proton channel family protein [Litorilituus lipolyticus]|uniref:Transporter n=1 Tax=Litorilituus lipolyticus TaxID=2491017 RepID=A0A502LF49_9GAMM|nr:MotA/TolQ/ExbB proton channel family protein [Litorilituus lipolyticus]TPH18607.1 transporter [Litorilituus lipolyticus]